MSCSRRFFCSANHKYFNIKRRKFINQNPHNYTSFYAFFHITFCVPLKQQSFTNFHISLLALDISFLSFTYFLFSFFPLAHRQTHTHSFSLFLLLIYFIRLYQFFSQIQVSQTQVVNETARERERRLSK